MANSAINGQSCCFTAFGQRPLENQPNGGSRWIAPANNHCRKCEQLKEMPMCIIHGYACKPHRRTASFGPKTGSTHDEDQIRETRRLLAVFDSHSYLFAGIHSSNLLPVKQTVSTIIEQGQTTHRAHGATLAPFHRLTIRLNTAT